MEPRTNPSLISLLMQMRGYLEQEAEKSLIKDYGFNTQVTNDWDVIQTKVRQAAVLICTQSLLVTSFFPRFQQTSDVLTYKRAVADVWVCVACASWWQQQRFLPAVLHILMSFTKCDYCMLWASIWRCECCTGDVELKIYEQSENKNELKYVHLQFF